MPWDVPEPDPVPYTDADLAPSEELPEAGPVAPPGAEPSASSVDQAPVAESPGAAVLAPAGVAREASAETDGSRDVGPGAAASSGLPPEFADIAAQLSAAFGQPLSVSVEAAATTSDEDAAAELSYDDVEEDPGFTDEPLDDSEDDAED